MLSGFELCPRWVPLMEYLPQASTKYMVRQKSKVFSSSQDFSSAVASLCRREAGDKEKVSAGGTMGWPKRGVSIVWS